MGCLKLTYNNETLTRVRGGKASREGNVEWVWLSVDPLHSERSWLTPYNYVQNNPVNLIDPTGMIDWTPEVLNNGGVLYQPEKGDNAESLASQYGLTLDQANAILCDGSAGTITGDDVRNVMGTDVLSLDLSSDMATDQRIVDQAVFAMDHSRYQDEWAFKSTDYFGGTQFKDLIKASGNISVEGGTAELELQIPIYRSATFDGSSKSTLLGNSPYTTDQTSGNRFPKTDLLMFEVYHPDTKNRMGDYRILAPRNKSDQIYD